MGDEKVDVEQLKKELERYKTFYENTPDEVKYFIERIGLSYEKGFVFSLGFCLYPVGFFCFLFFI